jgi:hypothetical protein
MDGRDQIVSYEHQHVDISICALAFYLVHDIVDDTCAIPLHPAISSTFGAPNQPPLNHPTATASYSTTLPTAHLPLPTSYDVPTKTGLDPIHTPALAPPTTPAYQATGHNNSSASTSPSPFTTTSANASAPYNPATPATPATTLPFPANNTPLAAAPSTLPHKHVAYALCERTKTWRSFAVY